MASQILGPASLTGRHWFVSEFREKGELRETEGRWRSGPREEGAKEIFSVGSDPPPIGLNNKHPGQQKQETAGRKALSRE